MKLFTNWWTAGLSIAALACVAPFMPKAFDRVYSRSEDLRHVYNQAANLGTPYHQRDLITFIGNGDYSALVSASSIVETGRVPTYAPWGHVTAFTKGNIYIDWQAEDAFTAAMQTIEEGAAADVAASPDLGALIAKPVWDSQDRMDWHRRVVPMVTARMTEIRGMKYRSEVGSIENPHDVSRTARLNDIARDIEALSVTPAVWSALPVPYSAEFDCEGESICKASLLEKLSKRFLSDSQRSGYYYVEAAVVMGLYDDTGGDHAYGVVIHKDEVLGVIEGTDGSKGFRELAAPLSFTAFVEGKPLVTQDGSVYGMTLTMDRADDVRMALGMTPYRVAMRQILERQAQEERMKDQLTLSPPSL